MATPVYVCMHVCALASSSHPNDLPGLLLFFPIFLLLLLLLLSQELALEEYEEQMRKAAEALEPVTKKLKKK